MPDFITSDGLRLHYAERGEGKPLLCLSGLTRNGTDSDYVPPHPADMRMIALDYRGRGRSDGGAPEGLAVITKHVPFLDEPEALMVLSHWKMQL